MKLRLSSQWLTVGHKVLIPSSRIVFSRFRKYIEAGNSFRLGVKDGPDARIAAQIPDHVLAQAPVHVLHAITHIGITGRIPMKHDLELNHQELRDWLEIIDGNYAHISRRFNKNLAHGILNEIRNCQRLFNELQVRKAIHEHQMASARSAGERGVQAAD